MGTYRYVVADAFTDIPLEGNPVAVFLDAPTISTERMQRIAGEMNLSETTFVLPARGRGDVRVRIFTPVNELPFAGHPILGTAIVLGESTSANGINIETAMGIVPIDFDRAADGRIVSVRMRQPVPTWELYKETDELLVGLGLQTSILPVEIYRNGPRHAFIGLDTVDALSRVEPNQQALARLPDMAANCFAGAGCHWRLRMFSPAYGVVEDAATGSAAGALAVHLARHGLISFGQEIEIMQGVEIGRPSRMRAKLEGTPERIKSIEVAGSAVVVARGTLQV
jgi:trans-2,3-dihydro-3-hydroxyanthranilate isomerase